MMGIKLKLLSLCVVAALGLCATTVVDAGAETGGHFISEASHTNILGHDELDNPVEWTMLGNTLRCNTATYDGTFTGGFTVESITVTPTFSGCEVPGIGPVHITTTGCTFTLTVRKVGANNNHNTVHLICPAGSGGVHLVYTGPFGNCVVTITPNQTPTQGVVYTPTTQNGKHAITMDVTMDGIAVHRTEGGFFQCGSSATTDSDAEIHGEIIVTATNNAGETVSLTAT